MERITPELKHVEQVSDGWVKKYVLTYELPDGTPVVYEGVSRKGYDAYCAELQASAARCRAFLESTGEEVARITADAVSIVPQTADGQLVLIREFRYPLNSWCVALPAGLVDPGEDVATAVDRELREETGYGLRADMGEAAVEPLCSAGYSSTGMSDETVHMVFAHVEKVGDAHPEAIELIEPFLLPIAQIPQFLEENRLPMGTRLQLVLEIFARQHS